MEFESTNSNTTAKLPILKLAQENGTSVMKMSVPATAEEKTNKNNDVKARSLLLMALPNEHQLTFSQYPDAKTSASSIESLDSIFNRLHKIVSRLAILGVVISQEDLNSKFLSSLPPEWNTHVVVKKSVGASSGAQNLTFMTTPSTSSTNHVNTAMPAYELSTASPDVNTASPQVSTASFSDNVVNGLEVAALSAKYEGKKSVSTVIRWDTLLGSVEHQEARKDSFDWSDMAKEQVQTNMALMVFSDSELNQTEFTATTYKRGLATVEEQLITYIKNEVLFSKEVIVLKREVACKDYEINVLKSEFEKVKQEKEGMEFKIEKFDKASKDLDKLLESKKLDLSYSSLDEFKEPEFKGYGSEDSKKESNVVCNKKSDDYKENSDNSLVKEQVSKYTSSFVESSLNIDKETIFPVDKKPQQDDTGFVNSGFSRHMTGNIAYLLDFKEFDEGYVKFGRGEHSGRISGKGTLKTDSLDFEDIYFVNELKFNLFSVSQIYFLKFLEDNMYSFDMKNIVPKETLT
ncbi:hypothetical protein Tco_1247650 [Tanacetum coccineum]